MAEDYVTNAKYIARIDVLAVIRFVFFINKDQWQIYSFDRKQLWNYCMQKLKICDKSLNISMMT